jgi:hypothetical protein
MSCAVAAAPLATCILTCLNLAAQRGAVDSGAALGGSQLGGACATCESTLASCGGTAGAVELGSSNFRCGADFPWRAPASGASTGGSVRLRRLCYPPGCSSDDVKALFAAADVAVRGNTTLLSASGKPFCDIFGSFADRNFPWIVCGGAVALFIVTLCLACCQCLAAPVLRCLLYAYLLCDAAIGVGFIVGYVLVLGKNSFPQYLVLSVVGVAVFQLVVALLLWRGGRPGGTRCCLLFATLLAGVASVLCMAAGVTFQLADSTMLREGLEDILDVKSSELDDLEDFILTTHLFLTCAFFAMSGLHASTIPLSRRISRTHSEAVASQREKAELQALKHDQRRQREEKGWVEAHRQKVAKEQRKHPQQWA